MTWRGHTLRILGWTGLVAAAVGVEQSDSRPFVSYGSAPSQPVLKDLVYRRDGGRVVKLDVYMPPELVENQGNLPRLPGVLVIHGGSWIGGSKSEYGPQFVRLVQYGYVVFAADYRLARSGAPAWPGSLEDLREAVRWLRRHADEFRLDPNRLAALGSGAGGHLAALLGTFPPDGSDTSVSTRVQAVVSLYGPADLDALRRSRSLANDPITIFLGVNPAEEANTAHAASPITHVSGDDAPMLLIHGSDDSWVSPEQSRRFAHALEESGVPHRLIEVTGARHGFELMVRYPETRDLLPEVLAFLENVWQVHLGGLP